MHPPRLARTTAVAALALLVVTGCGSTTPAAPPKTVITLSDDLSGGTLPESAVTLGVGQRFAVEHPVGAQPRQWRQTSAGDARVLAHSGTAVASACPSAMAGCSTLTDDLYTAEAAGTTTVVWSYGSAVSCTAQDARICAPVAKTIKVVVR